MKASNHGSHHFPPRHHPLTRPLPIHSYVLALFFLLKYGLRMMRFTARPLPGAVLHRLLGLCAVCSVVFLAHAVFFLGDATGLIRSVHGYPVGVNAYAFDAIAYPVLELVPSIIILVIVHKKRGSTPYAYLDMGSNPYTVRDKRPGGPLVSGRVQLT
jgi:hypothetical protein